MQKWGLSDVALNFLTPQRFIIKPSAYKLQNHTC